MKNYYRKFRKNMKAISPIISTLLLIAIAVVAALVTYAWVMGYIGFQTSKSGDSIQIQSVTDNNSTGVLTVYVQNTGQASETFNSASLYVNGTQMAISSGTGSISPGGTVTLVANVPSGVTGVTIVSGAQATIKVTATDGTYNQATETLP